MTAQQISKRLATLERQLQRYLARALPPVSSVWQAKRRATLRRRVVRDNLRKQRCLRTQGNEIGWTRCLLTDADETRALRLTM